jgi:peptidoglycan/xylan/chitin deacetylase (PgdA/CDA1 family)
MKRIRILLYNQVGHYPLEAMEDGVHPESLTEQLDYLVSQDFRIVSLDQALSYMEGKEDLPEKSIVITIDGGYADAYSQALPILEQYNIKATFFIAPRLIGKSRLIKGHALPCMTWDQVRSLMDKGMGIGHYGCDGKAFKKVPKEAAEEDIEGSKPLFEKFLNTQPPYYGVFEGTPEPDTVELLKKHGYRAMFTKCPTKQRLSHFSISRIQSDDDDFNIFLVKTSKSYLQFKDSRYWKQIRKYHLAKAFHRLSEFYNRFAVNNRKV